jgi:hypothetical protein
MHWLHWLNWGLGILAAFVWGIPAAWYFWPELKLLWVRIRHGKPTRDGF